MAHGSRWVVLGFVFVGAGFFAGTSAVGCNGDYETRIIPPEEAGPPRESGTSDGNIGGQCPVDGPVDPTTLLYKSPTPPQTGKCDADDVAAMKDFILQNPKSTNEDFENFVKNRKPVCHDCIFADAAGATWPPAPLQDGKVLTFNVGACYALVTGSDACGKAVQNAWDCEFQSCAFCGTTMELESCRVKARSNVCKGFEDTGHQACIGFDADSVCGSPFDSIRVQCITTVRPITDGGTDAAADAAGDADAN